MIESIQWDVEQNWKQICKEKKSLVAKFLSTNIWTTK